MLHFMLHTKKNHSLRPPAVAEIIFDLGYLCFALGAGGYLLYHANGQPHLLLYGALALVLGGGDAFHLLPRVYSLWTGTMEQNYRALGLGKLVTSITMTIFYLLLCYLWHSFYRLPTSGVLPLAWGLVVLRVVFCLLPQNQWLSPHPPAAWGTLRNVPFLLLGGLTTVLYAYTFSLGKASGTTSALDYMWLAILLSFAFYLPVVAWAKKYPAVGALMLPKTCAYIWMLCMGFSLL